MYVVVEMEIIFDEYRIFRWNTIRIFSSRTSITKLRNKSTEKKAIGIRSSHSHLRWWFFFFFWIWHWHCYGIFFRSSSLHSFYYSWKQFSVNNSAIDSPTTNTQVIKANLQIDDLCELLLEWEISFVTQTITIWMLLFCLYVRIRNTHTYTRVLLCEFGS